MKQLLAALLLLAAATLTSAQTPTLMSYQGRVSDSSGNLIGNTAPVNRLVTFKFYTVNSGGAPIYAESQTVTISGGEFSVLLGNGNGLSGLPGPSAPALTPYKKLPDIATGPLYLGITVDDGTAAADVEISPRQQIVSTAYAFRAKLAEGVLNGALNNAMLADTSVTTEKISGGAITNAKLANDAVTTTNIKSGSIDESRLANNAVTNAKIANGAVTVDKLADGAINGHKISDNSVTSAKIADNSVTSDDIADGTITSADLASNAVTTVKIADRAVDVNKLIDAVKQALCPTGTILPFAGDTAPAGWQLCDGTSLSRSSQSALFAVIGTRFGAPDSASFRAPDLRGQFLRGRDGGAGRDPDRNSRSEMNPGGATGDFVGSVQGHLIASHSHNYGDIYHSEGGGTVTVPNKRGSGDTDSDNAGYEITRTSQTTGGNETRPTNVAVNYIIKL